MYLYHNPKYVPTIDMNTFTRGHYLAYNVVQVYKAAVWENLREIKQTDVVVTCVVSDRGGVMTASLWTDYFTPARCREYPQPARPGAVCSTLLYIHDLGRYGPVFHRDINMCRTSGVL